MRALPPAASSMRIFCNSSVSRSPKKLPFGDTTAMLRTCLRWIATASIRLPRPQTGLVSAKLAIACSSVGKTSKTSDSFVITKMFWIRLSTAHSFMWPARRT